MPDARDIRWGRLIAEGAAIIVSILLAFGIDAWWDERNERIEEQEILKGLGEEFRLIRDVLSAHEGQHLRRLGALESLLQALDGGEGNVPLPALVGTLDDLFSPQTSDISNGTLHALLSSGRLEMISSKALREKLVSWESAIDELRDDQQDHAKRVYEINVPYFVDGGYGFGDVEGFWYDDSPAPVRSISEHQDEMDRLLGDTTFRSMVEINYMYKRHLTIEFERAISAAEEILAEIGLSQAGS